MKKNTVVSIWSTVNSKPKQKYFLRNKPVSRIGFFGFKPITLNKTSNIKNIPKNNLTWPQASMKYPRLNPFNDSDRDGKLNMFDCRPFNKRKHGVFNLIPPEKPTPPLALTIRPQIIAQPTPIIQEPVKRRIISMSPPDELETGEILDPYYDEYLQNQEELAAQNQEDAYQQQAQQQQQIQVTHQVQQSVQPQRTVSTYQAIRRQVPSTNKWAKPGIYNEGDYLEAENAIDEYVGSGSGSATPVRGFNPGGSGTKYG